ncbi:MAG: protein kinase [Lentisphaeria bacterium]|nr:protein kinase [Lentisphaeria bacterium]
MVSVNTVLVNRSEIRGKTRPPVAPLEKYAHEAPEISPVLNAPIEDLESHYSMLEQFAEGGLSTLSIARDKNLHRVVAVKTLKTEAETKSDIVESFISEAKVTAQLDHPSIVPVYGLDRDQGGKLHLCMKLVNGKTLREYIEAAASNGHDDEADLRRRLEIFLHVCDAVAYAHDREILHHDLKPENIMIGEYMEVYVMDWGLAGLVHPDAEANSRIRGTPRYLSPELLRGEPCGIRSEVFTLGLILQEIVTLRFAISGETVTECLDHLAAGKLEPVKHLCGCRIDRPLAAIIRKATAIRQEDRYETVSQLAQDLRNYLAGFAVSAFHENVFSRLARWAVRHRSGCLAAVFALLFCCAAITAYAIFYQLRTVREQHEVRLAMNFLYNRAALSAEQLDVTAMQIQEQLLALARISAYLLMYNADPGVDTWRQSFRPTLSEIKKTEDGMFYSPYYKRLTSMDYGIYTLAPGADKEKAFACARKTAPVLRKMRNIVLGSMSGYNFDPKDYERLKMKYLYSGFPVRTVYIGTEEGLKLLYPWRGNYPRNVDPRKRAWYKSAMKKRGPVWGKPYMDFDSISGLSIPCAVPIIDLNERFRGVAGLDLSVNKLTERILSQGNTGKYVLEKAVIDRTGEVIFSSKSQYFNKKFDPEKIHHDTEFKIGLFRTQKIRDRILKSGRKYGAFIDKQNEKKIICSFADLEIFDMVFVVIADYAKLVEHIKNTGK